MFIISNSANCPNCSYCPINVGCSRDWFFGRIQILFTLFTLTYSNRLLYLVFHFLHELDLFVFLSFICLLVQNLNFLQFVFGEFLFFFNFLDDLFQAFHRFPHYFTLINCLFGFKILLDTFQFQSNYFNLGIDFYHSRLSSTFLLHDLSLNDLFGLKDLFNGLFVCSNSFPFDFYGVVKLNKLIGDPIELRRKSLV